MDFAEKTGPERVDAFGAKLKLALKIQKKRLYIHRERFESDLAKLRNEQIVTVRERGGIQTVGVEEAPKV